MPYPPAPPTLGPAGSIITDPSFGSRILRVTDASSDPKHPGTPYHTPAASLDNSWNKTSTKFFAGDTGGAFLLFGFDPSTMSANWEGRLNVPWHAEPQFSFINADILYGVGGREPAFQQYNLSNRQLDTLNNIGDCVKLGPSDSAYAFSISADDNRLSAVIGPQQDKNYLVYVYDRKRGCRWYNTQTGAVGGQWGPAGTVAVPYRVPIHYATISRNGEFVDIGASQFNGSSLIWEVGTTNVTLCGRNPLDQCTGHHALGYSHLLNSANNVHPLDFVMRPYDNLRSMVHLIRDLPHIPKWYDYHVSWNYNNPQDNLPACFSTYHPTNPREPGAPLLVNGPWENEIDCVETDGKASTVWRFGHTYSTAQNGFWSQPHGNVSQDGRFFAFTSDWQDELGRDPNANRYRTDVFVIELR